MPGGPSLEIMIAEKSKKKKEEESAGAPQESEMGGGCDSCLSEAFTAAQSGDEKGFKEAMKAAMASFMLEGMDEE